ncbi:hypothetical protein J4407_02670 [Candidatus Pacearchaeota archaeon]|nr:hypothetical protein [Candidatus Pacearchaeota archaeon]
MKNKLERITLGLILFVLIVYLLRIFKVENVVLGWLVVIALSLFLIIHTYKMIKKRK